MDGAMAPQAAVTLDPRNDALRWMLRLGARGIALAERLQREVPALLDALDGGDWKTTLAIESLDELHRRAQAVTGQWRLLLAEDREDDARFPLAEAAPLLFAEAPTATIQAAIDALIALENSRCEPAGAV